MSGNKNLYGLHSFNNFKDAWKFMCNFGTDGMDLQILNDNNFPSAVMEQIIIRLVEFRIGKIPREEIETNFGDKIEFVMYDVTSKPPATCEWQ